MEQNINKNIGVNILLDLENLGKTGTKYSAILDTAGFMGVVLGVCTGTFTGVDGSSYLLPVVQESSTLKDKDFADVVADDIAGAFVKIQMFLYGENSKIESAYQCVAYKGRKEFVRVRLEYTGKRAISGGVIVQGILGKEKIISNKDTF